MTPQARTQALRALVDLADSLGCLCELDERNGEMTIATGLTVSPTVAAGEPFTSDSMILIDEPVS